MSSLLDVVLLWVKVLFSDERKCIGCEHWNGPNGISICLMPCKRHPITCTHCHKPFGSFGGGKMMMARTSTGWGCLVHKRCEKEFVEMADEAYRLAREYLEMGCNDTI